MRKSGFLWVFTALLMPSVLHAQKEKNTEYSTNPLSLLITEIMFDPQPIVSLPAYEYVELYNIGPDTVDLNNWGLRVGEKKNILPSYKLAPEYYVVLSNKTGAPEFSERNLPVLSMEKWALLRNSGQFLALLSPRGEIIHFMTYHPSQFEDALKQEGGWSLELTDMGHACQQDAWHPSIASSGGTPGKENSFTLTLGDNLPSRPVRLGIQDEDKLLLILDKPIMPLNTTEWFSFFIEPSTLEIDSWRYLDDRPWMIEIALNNIIPDGTRFSLSVGGEATDCSGVSLISGTVEFGIPEAPDSSDVVISEIMFDPADNQPEFIGIHNASGKILALNDLYVATCDETGLISRFSKPVVESFLMFPGQEYALTSDGYLLGLMDSDIPLGQICEKSDMPALSNQGSILCILDESQKVLDMIRYYPAWHDPRLEDTKGISLERIRLDLSGWFSSNWHSASIASGGSTPGMENSQRSLQIDVSTVFSIENRAFCPDQDGYGDYLLIRISTGEPGWIGSAGVWNLAGSQVKELSAAGALPINGVIKWDGSDELGNRVPSDYYVIILNYIKPDGSKGRWKEACVVTAY